jgi:hypothetical protein
VHPDQQEVKHGLLFKAAREISSGMLKPFGDLFPPNHCCFIHAPKNFFVILSPSDETQAPEKLGKIFFGRKNTASIFCFGDSAPVQASPATGWQHSSGLPPCAADHFSQRGMDVDDVDE